MENKRIAELAEESERIWKRIKLENECGDVIAPPNTPVREEEGDLDPKTANEAWIRAQGDSDPALEMDGLELAELVIDTIKTGEWDGCVQMDPVPLMFSRPGCCRAEHVALVFPIILQFPNVGFSGMYFFVSSDCTDSREIKESPEFRAFLEALTYRIQEYLDSDEYVNTGSHLVFSVWGRHRPQYIYSGAFRCRCFQCSARDIRLGWKVIDDSIAEYSPK